MNALPDLELVLDGITADLGLFLLQSTLFLVAFVLVFLVFFTTRDILLRTHSLLYQVLCIFLVALFPVVGFFLYLLIRPSRTLKDRALHDLLCKIDDALTEVRVSSSPATARIPSFTVSTVEKHEPKKRKKKA